ncbi:MAG: hypothetical protein V2A58_00680 [Planctomycetota bacterium]
MLRKLLPVCVLAALFAGHDAFAEDALRVQWRRAADLPQAVGGPAAGVLGGKLVVAGGTFWENAEKKFWIPKASAYDVKADSWTPLSDLPKDTAYSCAVSTQDAVYVFGGACKDETWPDTWKLVAEGDGFAWKPFVPLPNPLCNMEAALIGGTAYVVAGTKDGNDLATSVDNNVWRIDLAAPEPAWKACVALPGPLRCGVGVAACGEKLYAFGGAVTSPLYGGSGNSDEAYVYDPAASRWTRIADTPYPASWWWAVTFADRYVILAGGHLWSSLVTAKNRPTSDTYGFMREVLVYDTKTGVYSLLEPLPMGIIDYGFARIGNEILLVGGEDAPRHRANWLMIGTLTEPGK